MIQRGSVVAVDFARTDPGADVRPALVIQNDRDNFRLQKTIVAQITGNTSRLNEPTQYFIDPLHPDWGQTGLRFPCVVNCSNITTIPKDDIIRALGALSPIAMQQIDECLKAALEII